MLDQMCRQQYCSSSEKLMVTNCAIKSFHTACMNKKETYFKMECGL